jgi:putative drug exporter of the RND superfamily
MFARLGSLVLRLRFVFAVAWLAGAVAFGLLAPSLAQVGSADETSFLPADAESVAARQIDAAAFPSDSAPSQALIVFSRGGGLTDADRAAIDGLRAWLTGAGHPAGVLRYVTAEQSSSLASMFRSADGVVELARVDLSYPSFVPQANAAIDAIRAHLGASDLLPAGLEAQVTGQAGIGRDYLKAIQEGTDRTTLVTIVLVVVVLLLIYRAPLAALVPLMTIGAAFLVSRGLLGFLAQGGWKLSSVLDSFIVVLVFGVGTDYTIFMISRFREELARNDRADAVRVTISRISAVIAASAATVIVGLASMVVARFGMIQTTGPALAIAVFVTLLAGLTLTPSLLAIFGRRLFWPQHEQTRVAGDEGRGFWANLARRITDRPGRLAAAVLVLLAVPLLALPQLKENFDVLQELPANAVSRQGFDTLSRHLDQGQLMPLSVYVQVPGGHLGSQNSLAGIGALEAQIVALPNVGAVRSAVDPLGEGKVSDLVRPSVQLAGMAAAFAKPAASDLSAQLGDAGLASVRSAEAYVQGLAAPFPNVSASAAMTGTLADLSSLEQGILQSRAAALVSNQLDSIVVRLQDAAGGSLSADETVQLASLKAYLDELGSAVPAAKSVVAYADAGSALEAVTARQSPIGLIRLESAISDLSAWFSARPAPTYFSPASIPPDAAEIARHKVMASARASLPGELEQLAAAFSPTDLYVSADILAAFESAPGDVTRLYVTTVTNPYDTPSFDTVRDLRTLLADGTGAFGPEAHIYLGGSTAEFTDVQTTIASDFLRVAAITILGILIVLVLLLRAIVAPIYLVLTVLLSYAMSLSLSALILQRVFGQPGLNYFIPLMVFVLLVALGSDYNIFLMSRVREESSTRGLRAGIRSASARTGTVITSAGLILAGTFGALVSSPLQLLFQVGLAVALGVLIDTFVVRSLLVPALTAFIGERAWWPFHRRTGE